MDDCKHKHLRFLDGSFLIQCIDCDQKWAAVDARNAPDYTAKGKPMFAPFDTRHDRWEMPRTDKLPDIRATSLKKPAL